MLRASSRLRAFPVATMITILAVALLGGCGSDDKSKSTSTADAKPQIVNTSDLSDAAGEVDHPVYGIAGQSDKVMELTETKDGKFFIRYLNSEDELGSDKPEFLTVGTYPVENAYGTLQALSSKPSSVTATTPDGGLIVFQRQRPESVYIAYPGADEQIEVFDPSAREALQLAKAGSVEPIN
jgi:hypothetical protein